MIRIRLIYEQIEAAKLHLEGGSVLGWRLALILLDNAAGRILVKTCDLVVTGSLRFVR